MENKNSPPVIEGRYQVVGEGAKARREPMFYLANAAPLLALVAIRAAWVLLTRH